VGACAGRMKREREESWEKCLIPAPPIKDSMSQKTKKETRGSTSDRRSFIQRQRRPEEGGRENVGKREGEGRKV